MSLITTLARLEAVRDGRARPLATVRHRHLAEKPFVFVPLTTAGEAGAPLGAMVGTDPDTPRLLVVPQPRDRDLRSAFLAELAEAMLPYIESYAEGAEYAEDTENTSGSEEPCADAPQLLVPSAAGVEYVRLLGRSMRFRRTAEQDPDAPHPAPPRVPLLGRWLTHFGERARVPGSSLLPAMTQLLGRHWATGQSVLEDQHLGALLAWIDPPHGLTGAEAAARAERERDRDGLLVHPPAGPATDPVFDNKRLAPAIARYDQGRTGAEREIHDLLETQLRPTWDAVWRGVGLLRALPEGAHVADRWKRDRWSYTAHRDRLRAGEPPQPKQDDAVTAARKLGARETAQAQLDAQEALDDPLVMAGRRLAGEAFEGEVTAVVMEYSQAKVPRPRPLVTVRTGDAPHPAEGARLHRALPGGKSQSAEFVAHEADGTLTVRLTGGMGRGKVPEAGSVPEPGDTVCWTLFEHAPRGGPELPDPDRTPWTHGGPPAAAAEAPDPVTAEDLL
ncbi:hypothetical protein FHS39_001246 [Streptomyces olivoverticillatus]|uniref:Uncharacterized protein n=1 Tax=Streptomyces olivoverticillatus TaxID=66427 RepID=A0A7W7PKZ2_9ACTN|nr:hypothetical protein [Streptomyces olivoverticillatus]MBB4892235.1 hypothetical protein [Streptomyces olivoverticillatus]